MIHSKIILYIFFCILYGAIQILIGTISKIQDKYYNYAPLPLTLFYITIFYPILLMHYSYNFPLEKLMEIKSEHLKEISIPALIYSVETVLSYWCLSYVPISLYIMARTCTAFVNVVYSKLYLKKHINYYYYVGLMFLLISYVLFLMGSEISTNDTTTILSIVIAFGSCITTSTYNNMAERFFDKLEGADLDHMRMAYQVIFSMYNFMFVMPVALFLALYNMQFIYNPTYHIIYSIAGICFQLSNIFRLSLLSTTLCSGNQALTVTDLTRRLVTNLLAYTFFDDYFNTEIIFGNIFMFLGSCVICIGVFVRSQ